jgi:hypothetical protein
MIGNIGVMGSGETGGRLGGEGGGGEIHGPENHSGCVKVDTPGGEDAIDLGPIECEVAGRLWDAPAEDKGAALRPSHVMGASNGIQVMAATGASADGSALAVAAVGQDVATGTDDEVRIHKALCRVNYSG